MAIIIKKASNEIHPEQAVLLKKDLPFNNNKIQDVRYVKSEKKFYMFTGYNWIEIDLVIE
jgi:hypothetical protein